MTRTRGSLSMPFAPVIFWQGLVRPKAVASVFYGVPNRLAESWEYGMATVDCAIALVSVIGMMRMTGGSFFELLQCKTLQAA
jgi:hypothetical protein